MSKNINTIIFDLGGVLIDWNPMYVYTQVFKSEEKAKWFLNNVCTLEWNEQHDGGLLIKDGERQLIAKFPEWKQEILTYYQRWDEMLKGPIEDTVELLLKLHEKQEHKLLALTNWSAETFPVARERYDFLQLFEGIVVSGEENMKKPDPAIYKLILDRYNCTAEECVFLDDNLRNIDAAAEMGINAIHFKDAASAIEILEEHGIEIS